jgi:CrcB protein
VSAGDDETPPLHAVTPEEAIAEAELPQAPEDLPVPARPRAARWRERLTPFVAISTGTVLGANARYQVGLWAAARWGSAFPWGTLLVNLTGSFLLGFYLTLVTERFTGRAATRLFVATGFCGAYTTFSTFSYETVALVQQGTVVLAALYVAGSLVLGLLAVAAGVVAARSL